MTAAITQAVESSDRSPWSLVHGFLFATSPLGLVANSVAGPHWNNTYVARLASLELPSVAGSLGTDFFDHQEPTQPRYTATLSPDGTEITISDSDGREYRLDFGQRTLTLPGGAAVDLASAVNVTPQAAPGNAGSIAVDKAVTPGIIEGTVYGEGADGGYEAVAHYLELDLSDTDASETLSVTADNLLFGSFAKTVGAIGNAQGLESVLSVLDQIELGWAGDPGFQGVGWSVNEVGNFFSTDPPPGPVTYTQVGGGCFIGETPVLMADGTERPIAEVKIGDAVMAFDADGHLKPAPVTRTYIHEERPLYDLAGLKVTPEHPFLCLRTGVTERSGG